MSIRPLRTEGSEGLATVCFEGSWFNGRAPATGTMVEVRGVIVWRKERDGRWRVAIEHIA